MEDLIKFFEDVRVIRQILERKEADRVTAVIAPQAITQPIPIQEPQPQMPVQPIPVQAIQPQETVQPQILVQTVPTTAQAESFTQEQIAVAMSRAQTMGRMDLIQQIFSTFGVQTLMQINPANYNQIAVMLREAGIEV